MKPIYLDNSSARPICTEALEILQASLAKSWANPHALHSQASEILPKLEKTYDLIYQFLGLENDDSLVFCSSSAEAINHVICSVFKDYGSHSEKRCFLSSSSEDANIITAIAEAEGFGAQGSIISPDENGIISAKALEEAITEKTLLFSLSWANGISGVIQPIEEISKVCKKHGVFLHLDLSHVLGNLYLDLSSVRAEFLSFEGNAFHGPQSTAGLVMRSGFELSPLIASSNEQGGLRGGIFSPVLFYAMAEAAKQAGLHLDSICTETARLRNKLEDKLCKELEGTEVLFKEAERLPHCSCIRFRGVHQELLLFYLNEEKIYPNSSSQSSSQLERLLFNCGKDPLAAKETLQFSLSRFTSEEEIEICIDVIKRLVLKLRKYSANVFQSQDFNIKEGAIR